jgi:hypothetical protein
MSNVKWTGTIPSVIVISDTPYPNGAGAVLDIVTGSGNTQMYLYTAYPNPGFEYFDDPPVIGYDALTATDAANTAAALQSAVNDLDGVTDSTLTTISVTTGPFGNANLLFDSAGWTNYVFTITLPTQDDADTEWAALFTSSPADGMLSSDDISTITSALVSFIEGLDTVTACTVAQATVTPDTL